MQETPVDTIAITTADGWTLQLVRGRNPTPGARPVLLVPGYGMNASIFRYHATGPSFFDQLAAAGLDPWAVDLRGASTTRCRNRRPWVTLADQAFVDLPTVIRHIREATGAPSIGAIGCSLGGTLLYGLVAGRDDPGIDHLVAMGSPLRWTRTPLVWGFLAAAPFTTTVPFFGSRRLAHAALPIVARFAAPALRIYLNTAITQIQPAASLTRTVEDPLRSINFEMARWMARRDLQLGSISVTHDLRRYTGRLLIVHSADDGICDRQSALSALDYARGPVSVLEVAHPTGAPVGHADLFLCDAAPDEVFRPVADFLKEPR